VASETDDILWRNRMTVRSARGEEERGGEKEVGRRVMTGKKVSLQSKVLCRPRSGKATARSGKMQPCQHRWARKLTSQRTRKVVSRHTGTQNICGQEASKQPFLKEGPREGGNWGGREEVDKARGKSPTRNTARHAAALTWSLMQKTGECRRTTRHRRRKEKGRYQTE